jgi:hypothetical protein
MEPKGSLPCPLVPIMSQVNPVLTTSSHFSKIHFNIIAHLYPGLPSGFPAKILYVFLFSPCALHTLPIRNFIFLIIYDEEYNTLCTFNTWEK